MKIILIGEENSKRTEYFCKAAERQQVSVTFLPWNQWSIEDLEGGVVKIDPPSFDSCRLLELPEMIGRYQEQLHRLAEAVKNKNARTATMPLDAAGQRIHFLNHPEGILKALDKVSCKRILQDRQVAVTEMLGENPRDFDELRQIMREHRARSVFIKPVYGSGAVGVAALSMQPSTGNMAAYTSVYDIGGALVQQKKIRKMTDTDEIIRLLHQIMALDTIVERWHPKAKSGGENFDFRVLWQFGKVEYLVARKSAGPITNLHLNNHAVSVDEIFTPELPWNREQVIGEIEDLCRRAMEGFPELSMAGLDIMLDKKTGRPRIIEINGQGDLLYADIYAENWIYGAQTAHMTAGEGII